MQKALWGLILLSLLGTARCASADLAAALGGVPFVGGIVAPQPGTPAYLRAIGTPAPVSLPEVDFTAWFAEEPPPDAAASETWQHMELIAVAGAGASGWAEVCKEAASAAGSDRAASPLVGALACSSDPTVTRMQRFALELLGARAAVGLWMRGDRSVATIQGRQGQLRLSCSAQVIARQGPPDNPWTRACELALDASYLDGDGPATLDALIEAYTLVAAEIARLDPDIDTEPGYFGAAPAP
ncbi:MAG: hypothetical protein AMXMBFR80_13420 [Dehalococcoidia bacterium]